MFDSSFYRQLWLIPHIKFTFMKGKLLFVINKRQFPIQLCFAMTVNKLQKQSFNFVKIDLCIPVFTHKQLYVALLKIIDICGLLLLLLQRGDAVITNIIYLKVLLQNSVAAVTATKQ